MQEFISEDDLDTFEGWLRYQGFEIAALKPNELEMWRGMYEEDKSNSLASPKVGSITLKRLPGEHQYAVAVREGSDLWLTLWVKRSRKGEIFVLMPLGDRDWDSHQSYHLDGALHYKSFGKVRNKQMRQPLTGKFQGTEQFHGICGFGPKRVGAICDPAAFDGVVEVAPGVLGPRHGTIVVDLVEPNCEPIPFSSAPLVRQEVFRETIPWIVVRVFS